MKHKVGETYKQRAVRAIWLAFLVSVALGSSTVREQIQLRQQIKHTILSQVGGVPRDHKDFLRLGVHVPAVVPHLAVTAQQETKTPSLWFLKECRYERHLYTIPHWAVWNPITDNFDGIPMWEPTLLYFTGVTFDVDTPGELTTALASCADEDIIEQAAGATVSGVQFEQRNRGDSGWVLWRTSAWASLPAAGERLASGDFGNLANLRCNTAASQQVVYTAAGSRGWYHLGVHFTRTPSNWTPSATLVTWGVNAGSPLSGNNPVNVPRYLVMDRCRASNPYTGHNTSFARRWISCAAEYWRVKQCHAAGFVEPGTDSQVILMTNSPGRFLLDDNYLQGMTENILFGGTTQPLGTNGHVCVNGNGIVRGNWFDKDTAWFADNVSIPGKGIVSTTSKNGEESKAVELLVSEGNIFTNHSGSGQQHWEVWTCKPQAEAENNWVYNRNITIRYQTYRNGTNGTFNLATGRSATQYNPVGAQRLEFCHSINESPAFALGSHAIQLGVGVMTGGVRICQFHSLHHLTFRGASTMFSFAPPNTSAGVDTMPNTDLRDSISYAPAQNGPIFASGGLGDSVALNSMCGSGLWNVRNNVTITDGSNTSGGGRTWDATLLNAPWNNKHAATVSAIGFAKDHGGAADDWSLVTTYAGGGANPFKGIGTNGTDPGPNWQRLLAMRAGALG